MPAHSGKAWTTTVNVAKTGTKVGKKVGKTVGKKTGRTPKKGKA